MLKLTNQQNISINSIEIRTKKEFINKNGVDSALGSMLSKDEETDVLL